MTRKTGLIVASILAVLHIALAFGFASITPYRTPGILLGQRDPSTGQYQSVPDIGAPDERQHVNYTRHLLDGEGFPMLDPNDPNLGENYQAHQPPLFYLIHAAWSKVTVANLESKDEGLKLRAINGLIGGLTVFGTFFLGLWGFKREDVGLLSATFVALLPMNIALSGAVSNDPLLYCLCTWTLAILAKATTDGWSLKLAALCGLLAGLAILTKTTAVALTPILLLACFLSEFRPRAQHVAAALATLLIVAAPWLVRNQSIYGDPLALNVFNEAFKNSPSRELITQVATVQNEDKDPNLAYWVDWVGWWTARSFVGAFGYMDIFLNERGIPSTGPNNPNFLYRLMLCVGVLITAAWALALRSAEWRVFSRKHWLFGAFLIIVTLLFLRFNAQFFQGQARYLFPAISVFGLGYAIALLFVLKSNLKLALGLTLIGLGFLDAYVLSRLPQEFNRRATYALGANQTHFLASNVLLGNDANWGRV